MKRERLLVLLQSGDPYSQPEPALACAVFLARETNAALELFLSDHQAGLRGSSACADLRGTQATLEAVADRLVNEIQRAAEKTLTEKHAAALQNEQRSLYLFIIANLLVLAVIAYLLVSRERVIREREAQARRESEQRFGQMAAMTGEWLWEQDAEGRFHLQ